MENLKFDSAQFEQWITQAADATISDENLESLIPINIDHGAISETMRSRVVAAINAYCHIVTITRDYKDVNVDLETSRDLLAKLWRGEQFTNEDIRLLGKRSSNRVADRNLRLICFSPVDIIDGVPIKLKEYPTVDDIAFLSTFTDEQSGVFADSLFEQAIVHGTGNITDKAMLAPNPSKDTNLKRKLNIAYGISYLTAKHDWALHYSKLSPEEKLNQDRRVARLHAAIHGTADPTDGDSGAKAGSSPSEG